MAASRVPASVALVGLFTLAACPRGGAVAPAGLPSVQVEGDASAGEVLLGTKAHTPSVAVGSDGRPWVAWTLGVGPDSLALVARRTQEGWRALDARRGCDGARLAAYAPEGVVALWTCGDGPVRDVIVAAYREDRRIELPGNDRGPLTKVRWEVGRESSMAVDAAGRVVVAAATPAGLAVFRREGAGWERLPAVLGASSRVHGTAIAVDARGVPVVAWSEQRDATARDLEIYAARFDGGRWSPLGGTEGPSSRHAPTESQKHDEGASVFCTLSSGSFDFTSPALARRGAGMTLAFEGDTVGRVESCPAGQVFAGTYASPDAAWDGPADVAKDVGLGSAGSLAETPALAPFPPDEVLIAWVEAPLDGGPRWVRVRRSAGARWAPVPELPDVADAFEPALAASATTACLATRAPDGIAVRCASLGSGRSG